MTTDDETTLPQEPEGKTMGTVRESDRIDPITGQPLYTGEEPLGSSNPSGGAYGNPADKGLSEESMQVPPAHAGADYPPRKEKGLRDL